MTLVVAAIALVLPAVSLSLYGRRLLRTIPLTEWRARSERATRPIKLLTVAIAIVPWIVEVSWPAVWSIGAWLSWCAGGWTIRRVTRGDTRSLARCLWFDLRVGLGGYGYWVLLAATPTLIADAWLNPILLGIALVLWASYAGYVWRAVVGVRPLDRGDVLTRLRAFLAPTQIDKIRFVVGGPSDAVWPVDVAWPHERVVFFSRTLCDRLDANELTALGAHALMRIDAYRRRRRFLPPVHVGRVLVAVIFAPVLPLGPIVWIAYVAWLHWRVRRRLPTLLSVFDRSTADLLGDGEPLVSALVAKAALEQPRQLDAESARALAADSLHARIAAIRAPRPAPPKAGATTAAKRSWSTGLSLALRTALVAVALLSAFMLFRISRQSGASHHETAGTSNGRLSGMGKSYGHIALYGPSAAAVAAAVADRQAVLSPTVNGYTLVADESFLTSDGSALAAELSQKLGCPALLIDEYHEDILAYELYEAGKKTDEYNSEPDYFDFAWLHIPPRPPQGGDAKRLSGAFGRRDAHATVDRILHKRSLLLDESERHRQLAEALNMPKFAVRFGYGALHGVLPDELDEAALVFTPKAKRFREIEKRLALRPPLLPRIERETTPSGKQVVREYRADGSLSREIESHADAAGKRTGISRIAHIRRGHAIGESYIVGARLAPRELYERARVNYPDMPAADTSIEDVGTERLEDTYRRTRWRGGMQPPAEVAREMDRVANEVMNRGRHEDAVAWTRAGEHTFADLNAATTRFLVDELVELGAVAVYACRLHTFADGFENSDHLVIELPTAPQPRANVIHLINIITTAPLFGPHPDFGQRYAYVRFE